MQRGWQDAGGNAQGYGPKELVSRVMVASLPTILSWLCAVAPYTVTVATDCSLKVWLPRRLLCYDKHALAAKVTFTTGLVSNQLAPKLHLLHVVADLTHSMHLAHVTLVWP